MSELRKANTDRTYFLTFTVVGWIDLFTRQRYCELMVENFIHYQKNKGLDIFAWVIMPSHIHLIGRSLEGKLNMIVRDLKSYTAKEILELIRDQEGESRKEWLLHMFRYYAKNQNQNKHYQVWQKTSHPIELTRAAVIDQKIEYIHNNPVESGFVVDPESWVYSSASAVTNLEVLET